MRLPRFFRRKRKRRPRRLINQLPDNRVTPEVQLAIERVLTGEAQDALILYFHGETLCHANMRGNDDRHVGIGLANLYLMCQQAIVSTQMQQQAEEEDDDEDDEETVA